MTKVLNRAHQEALELLKIVDEYCVRENIIYTLSGSTLIALGNIDFSQCYPALYIAVEYEGFRKIVDYLKEFCLQHPVLSVHNYENTKQF